MTNPQPKYPVVKIDITGTLTELAKARRKFTDTIANANYHHSERNGFVNEMEAKIADIDSRMNELIKMSRGEA